MEKLRQALGICCILILGISLRAIASIKQFSASLVSTQTPTKTESPSITKVYKAQITQSKIPELKTAIVWHAPPYKSLSKKLSPSEETLRDEEAMQILLNGTTEINEDLMKAKNIISKKEPLVFKVGRLIARNSELEDTTNLPNLIFNSRGKDDAQELINRTSTYIYQNYQDFKAFYQASYSRNIKLIEQHNNAKAKLELISGINAVANIEALLNGGRI